MAHPAKPESLDFIFAEGGPLSQSFARFEPRKQQAEMTRRVYSALESKTHLIVEAGTGVGKSLAYLIPLGAWACAKGRRAVVATHTKALQQQLMKKDLPIARKVLNEIGMNLSFALLMGSENYICVRRLLSLRHKGKGLFQSEADVNLLTLLADYAQTGSTGLRSALPSAVPDAIWCEMRRESDLCLRRHCPGYDRCLHRKDVAAAREARVVVVNQHLFFAGMPLPSFDAVVFDEAHNLEEAAADYLGYSVSSYRVRQLLGEIYNPRTRRGFAPRLKNASDSWLGELASGVEAADMKAETFFMDVIEALGMTRSLLAGEQSEKRVLKPRLVPDTLGPAISDVSELLSKALMTAADTEEETAIKAYKNRCVLLLHDINDFLDCEGKDKTYWVSSKLIRGHPFVELLMTPLDIAPVLSETLFKPVGTVILTSATLAVEGNFAMLRKNLGVPECPEALLDSPFNFRENAAIYIPGDMPDPKTESALFETKAARECAEIIKAVPGGVFVLFTSWQFLRRAAAALTTEKLARPVFMQGSMTPEDLIREFKRAKNGVLLATDTFWQGVDIPGEALSCVIITKLPFKAPDSPVEGAREEWLASRGVNVFEEYSLPKAVIKFHQGFGRLIRKSDDFGAVAVLDPRILARRYGVKFIRSVPDCALLRDIKSLRKFFAGHRTG